MSAGPQKRQKRHPLTAEEVADIIAYKKRREHEKLAKFRTTRRYKALNIFNLACFFVYFELLFCFFGPCVYQNFTVKSVSAHYGEGYRNETPYVTDFDIVSDDHTYRIIAKDYIDLPEAGTSFSIGKDFLLGKELKAAIESNPTKFRLFSASPVVILCGLALSISFIAVFYNLNQNSYSLNAMSVLNGIVMLGLLLMR
jgi:hypothetical protein